MVCLFVQSFNKHLKMLIGIRSFIQSRYKTVMYLGYYVDIAIVHLKVFFLTSNKPLFPL
jgi:hypothetical protein